MSWNDDIILAAQGVTKRFGGVKALDGANLEVRAGQVTAVMGENCAGKSTLMKVLAGVYQDYEGKILLGGREVDFANPRQAQEQGVTLIHQELNLIPNLSVAKNIFLGRECVDRLGLIDYRRMGREAAALLRRLDLDVDPGVTVSSLRMGQQQIVEIARALALQACVIIMDEPTSAISEHEVDVLFGLICALKREGVAIVYISHKMDEVFRIADWITVMRDGRTVGCAPRPRLGQDDVVRMMVGRDLKDFFVQADTARGRELLHVERIRVSHPDRPGDFLVQDVSLSVAAVRC